MMWVGDQIHLVMGLMILIFGLPMFAVAEQLRERVLALNLPQDASPLASHVTLSFGVSSSELASVSTPAELIRTSDIALDEAKRSGRNQIVARRTASDRVG